MKRNIFLNLLFCILTCGIYYLFWVVQITDDAKKLSKEDGPSGIFSLLLIFLTCGLYNIFWYYKIGTQLTNAQLLARKPQNTSLNILCVLLGIFGFGMISTMILQDAINGIVDNNDYIQG